MPPGSSRRESGQHKPKQALRASEDCAIEPGQRLDAEQKLFCGDVSGQRQGLDIKSMTNYDMKLQTLHVHSFSPRVSEYLFKWGSQWLWGFPNASTYV